MNKLFYVLLAIALVMSLSAQAQELSPRAYWPSPVGTRIVTIGYSHVSEDITPNPSSPVTGVDSSINTLHLGYRHTLSLWDRTANFIIELPYSDGDTVADFDPNEDFRFAYNGAGDVTTTLSVNFLGAPTMTQPQFVEFRHKPQPILGGSLKVVVPAGAYDSDRAINVGSNRWALKAELGYITSFSPRWLLEADLGSWFFLDNDDFLGMTMEQKPIVAIEGHLVHRFKPGLWASLDINFYRGGQGTLDGVKLDNLERNAKVGATVVYPFGGRHAIKVGYSSGSLTDLDERFRLFLISYQRLL